MNPLAQAADSLGCLTPDPGLLKQLMRQPLGAKPLRIRSGGNSSRCASDGCWTLDLRRHREILHHEATQEVEFGTGLTMAELLQALRSSGRSLPIGLSGLTGSGFILSGGMGPLSRSQGLALDHITAIQYLINFFLNYVADLVTFVRGLKIYVLGFEPPNIVDRTSLKIFQ